MHTNLVNSTAVRSGVYIHTSNRGKLIQLCTLDSLTFLYFLYQDKHSCVLKICTIQGDTGGICSILGNDSMCDSKQKTNKQTN